MTLLFWKVLLNLKKYLYLALLVFIIGIFIGYLFLEQNHPMIQDILKQIGSIAEKVREKNSLFYMIQTIFFNNLLIAILMILSGFLFGIYPMVNLMVQGIMIGFLIKFLFQQGKTIGFVVMGILPHGILEIPAILIASSFGMKVGFSTIQFIVQGMRRKKDNIVKNFLNTLKEIPIVSLGLAILLFIAAIIESTLTVFLLQTVYH
ncbi:stage II sporulation protein M [Tepidibacillus sp. LV47]|uniref:stage II sporulation protein M n=1 Tax=Tepidibacillus sp. LV47 TaxID=3398228 RepID=UPI003AB09924